MTKSEGTPPVPERYRMLLRLGAVALGYVVYRLVEPDHFGPALMLGFGVWIFSAVMIERYSTRRSDRSGLMQVGSTILGLGLVVLGLALVLR